MIFLFCRFFFPFSLREREVTVIVNRKKTMEHIFNPKSIAIIGASAKIGSIGNTVVQNLVDSKYAGKIYPINPNAPRS